VSGDVVISQSVANVTCDEADMSLTISDSPDPVTSGNNLSYTSDIQNNGPDSANDVVVDQTLPGGVSFVSATPSQGSCGHSSGVVTCDLGVVGNGGNPTITVVVIPNSPGAISTTASVSAKQADPSPGNNSDTEDTTVQSPAGSADLSVTLSDSPDPVTAGMSFTVTANILNAGPNDATNSVYTHNRPSGVNIDSVSAGQGSCMITSIEIVCNLGTIPNAGGTFVEVEMTPLTAGTVNHIGIVESDVADPNLANNADSHTAGVASVRRARVCVPIRRAPAVWSGSRRGRTACGESVPVR
jgi:uncharacterized repeat protein (TIGR01451 family)